MELKANDTLFIRAKKDFARKWDHSRDFSLVTSSFHPCSKTEKKWRPGPHPDDSDGTGCHLKTYAYADRCSCGCHYYDPFQYH